MKMFFLLNFKPICHLLSLMLFIAILFLLGFYELMITSIPFLGLIFVVNYYITVFSVKKSGLEEEIEKQLKKIEDKKTKGF